MIYAQCVTSDTSERELDPQDHTSTKSSFWDSSCVFVVNLFTCFILISVLRGTAGSCRCDLGVTTAWEAATPEVESRLQQESYHNIRFIDLMG